jgi:hypothetical protein
MNIDLAATTGFNDAQGLQNFMLAHRFVHLETSNALTAKFGVPVSTFGIDSQVAENAWIDLMKNAAAGQKSRQVPPALRDWLNIHAQIHTSTYSLLGQSPTVAPDLSIVDFSDAEQFYDWMFVHMEMHQFEYASLGLT